jgi:hypothetical protein
MHNLHLPTRYPTVLPPPSLWLKEREREKIGKTDLKRTREHCCAYGKFPLFFIMFHGGIKLAYVRDHARTPAKSSKSGVFDYSGAGYLSCSHGSYVPCPNGGIRCGMLDILRVRIWCALASIPCFAAAVLWPGAASVDSFGGPAHCGLHNLVRGLHGD